MVEKILDRQWMPLGDDAKEQFTVMQWNVLADALSQSSPTNNFYKTLPAALEWAHRKDLIFAEIQRSGADIVCLEEVDHYHDFLLPEMTKLGYEGIFAPKPKSACLRCPQNNGPDGCALFYRKSMFKFLEKKEIRYTERFFKKPSNQLAILLMLEFHEQPLCIVVTHLKSRHFSAIRLQQAQQLMANLALFAQDVSRVVMCGDFNAVPTEPAYDYISTHSEVHVESAYCAACKGEPPYTSWKFRPGKETQYTIDYIWYSTGSLKLNGVLRLPSVEEIGPDALPMLQYPSDHLSLCARFSLL